MFSNVKNPLKNLTGREKMGESLTEIPTAVSTFCDFTAAIISVLFSCDLNLDID